MESQKKEGSNVRKCCFYKRLTLYLQIILNRLPIKSATEQWQQGKKKFGMDMVIAGRHLLFQGRDCVCHAIRHRNLNFVGIKTSEDWKVRRENVKHLLAMK